MRATAAGLRTGHNLIEATAESGSHVVALSGLGADLDSPFCYAVSYGYTEQLLRVSGCPADREVKLCRLRPADTSITIQLTVTVVSG